MIARRAAAIACWLSLLVACAERGDDLARGPARPMDPPTVARLGLTTRVPQAVVRACREIARKSTAQRFPRPVYCPPLVPDVRLKFELACGLERCRRFDDGYVVGLWSPSARRGDENGAHWTFSAGARSAVRVYSHHPHMSGIRPVRTRRTILAGTSVLVFRMPRRAAGFYAGHVGVEWAARGSTFHLTMHGYANAARVEAMAAAMIRQVRACAAAHGLRRRGGKCALVFYPRA